MKPQHTPHRFAPNVLVRQCGPRKRRASWRQLAAGCTLATATAASAWAILRWGGLV